MLAALWLLGSPAAQAQFGATAEVERPIPAGVEEDPTATATVVNAKGRARAVETTDELVLEVPGARVRRTGGFGSFTGLSVRGGDLDQTVVLFDHLPIGSRGSTFDLSTIPLSVVERIEVYRGGSPLWLGADGVGGVIRIVPREAEQTQAEGSVGVGSFGLVRGHAAASVTGEGGSPSWLTVVGMRHADNDYPVTDQAGTPDDPTDDFDRDRRNAGVDEGWALARAKAELAGGTLEALMMGFGRTGGLPGAPLPEPERARRNLTRAVAGLSWDRKSQPDEGPEEFDSWRVQLSAGEIIERDRLSDPLAEIASRPQETDDTTFRTFVRAAGSAELNDHVGLATTLRFDHEGFNPEDQLAPQQVESSNRFILGAAAEGRLRANLGEVRGEMRPSVRLEVAEADLLDIRPGREGLMRTPTTVAPTARLGFVIEAIRGLALNTSVSYSTRLPTIEELFGDRGFVLGNPRLDPERATSVEVGAVATGKKGVLSGQAEAHFFGLFVNDLIQFQRGADDRLRPDNTDEARILGVEGGLRGQIGQHFTLVSGLTWMDTRDETTGQQLPLRPEWQTYVRPEVNVGSHGPLSKLVLFSDLTYVSSNLATAGGDERIEDRLLLGGGVATEWLEDRLRFAVTLRDALDERPQDLAGFPLPGRSFRAELTVRTP